MATKKNSSDNSGPQIICRNRRARHNYEILDEINCGIVLTGSEVKSIRNNKIAIDEAYARVEKGEVWLYNCDIAEYPQATYMNHERRRPRKLLLHKREIRKFAENAEHQGMTLIPLTAYFSRGMVKATLGVAKGRKLHDKRDRLRKQEADKTMRQAIRKRS